MPKEGRIHKSYLKKTKFHDIKALYIGVMTSGNLYINRDDLVMYLLHLARLEKDLLFAARTLHSLNSLEFSEKEEVINDH